VVSITAVDGKYEVASEGGAVTCDAVVIATSLDESKILFTPPVNLVKRHMQHTFTTFVRGLLNSDYFGSTSESIPELIGTKEDPNIPFSSISILKEYNATDRAYKVFSRAPLSDELLDLLFSTRRSTIRIDWAAYPHYTAPEKFSPYILDEKHLYYINSFENAASAIEAAAVSAQNVARLLLSRLSDGPLRTRPSGVREEVPVDDL
jgi:prenylcysteine oxidase/farnesylcysteine lyase